MFPGAALVPEDQDVLIWFMEPCILHCEAFCKQFSVLIKNWSNCVVCSRFLVQTPLVFFPFFFLSNNFFFFGGLVGCFCIKGEELIGSERPWFHQYNGFTHMSIHLWMLLLLRAKDQSRTSESPHTPSHSGCTEANGFYYCFRIHSGRLLTAWPPRQLLILRLQWPLAPET